MVQEIERIRQTSPFPTSAPAANPVFYRTYSRRGEKVDNLRETWQDVCDRTLSAIVKLGKLTPDEADLLAQMQRQIKSLPSGRWLWVGGTQWAERPENFSGAYNCTSTDVVDWRAFGLMMDLAMMGCGTGAVLEPHYINQLPPIRNQLVVTVVSEIGTVPAESRHDETAIAIDGNSVTIRVGDSRQGWVQSYQGLLELSTDPRFEGDVQVGIDLSHVRPAGERLRGFGGVANPIRLPSLYERCAGILNKAIGRNLTSVECCLLIDEAAACVVAGNIRRSAGMRQFDSEDALAAVAKDNLWMQDAEGNWRIDPERDVLRMANHTRVFHRKPTLDECVEAVRKQFYSGEGAIQWAGEAERRAEGKGRYGLNPCVTADTWVHTEDGPRQVQELIGKQHGTYVNGELFSTTPEGFFLSGVKPVVKLQTQEGYALRLTTNHRVLKVTSQTQKAQYTEWVEAGELKAGDRILLHNHRGLQPWQSEGTWDEGWLLGNFVGDGCFAVYEPTQSRQGKLRYWGDHQADMYEFALATCQRAFPDFKAKGLYHPQNRYYEIGGADLFKLATRYGLQVKAKTVTPEIERASYDFYRGFLRGIFDADGSVQGSQTKGVSIRLSQSNLTNLQAIQRMLLRLGIASTLYHRRPEQIRLMPNSQRELAEYTCSAQYELVVTNNNLTLFQELIGFQQPDKAERLATLLAAYKRQLNRERFTATVVAIAPDGIEPVYDCTVPGPSRFDANGIVAHNCGEIIGANFHCNLAEVHLNQLDPHNFKEQEDAFTAGALSVAALLNHQFIEPRYQQSRAEDPIVGVSFTGLFDFFVGAFGVEWLHWWSQGRPDTVTGLEFKEKERQYLSFWKEVVHRAVWDYCDRHHLKRPNRCTTVQPAGTKSLLTNASPGWHPPKAQRFIRRITFRKNDPVALACMEYGYSIVPSQSDKDDNGNLLNDPFDPRCTEWLVEIPVEVPWANLPGADAIEIEKFSALSQFDFYMQVQQHYTAHNTSATIELYEEEIEPLATRIHQAIANDEGYISAALLARFNAPFPRLPFEKIDHDTFLRLQREVSDRQRTSDFYAALSRYDSGESVVEGPAGCDSDKCMLPEQGK